YGKDYCERYLAKPGYSEHHTGLAIDIFVIQKNNRIVRDNDDMIADIGDFAEIHQLLSKHGFILRYPDGKEDITGYSYEPWHLRYVGEDAARVISECGITLEEYLSSLS
ncbi:MAG: M15 family metallopeptidase, partial [Candidatus Saccharibacteria bacterium]|nr:M15 family metallopeptidase [Candidatus Saccharibacteria bacterium]